MTAIVGLSGVHKSSGRHQHRDVQLKSTRAPPVAHQAQSQCAVAPQLAGVQTLIVIMMTLRQRVIVMMERISWLEPLGELDCLEIQICVKTVVKEGGRWLADGQVVKEGGRWLAGGQVVKEGGRWLAGGAGTHRDEHTNQSTHKRDARQRDTCSERQCQKQAGNQHERMISSRSRSHSI